jgi:hypothetical protein
VALGGTRRTRTFNTRRYYLLSKQAPHPAGLVPFKFGVCLDTFLDLFQFLPTLFRCPELQRGVLYLPANIPVHATEHRLYSLLR